MYYGGNENRPGRSMRKRQLRGNKRAVKRKLRKAGDVFNAKIGNNVERRIQPSTPYSGNRGTDQKVNGIDGVTKGRNNYDGYGNITKGPGKGGNIVNRSGGNVTGVRTSPDSYDGYGNITDGPGKGGNIVNRSGGNVTGRRTSPNSYDGYGNITNGPGKGGNIRKRKRMP